MSTLVVEAYDPNSIPDGYNVAGQGAYAALFVYHEGSHNIQVIVRFDNSDDQTNRGSNASIFGVRHRKLPEKAILYKAEYRPS
jgi:hypothetical protein